MGASLSMSVTLDTPPEQRTVTIGDSNDTMIEILTGLSEGEFVVTKTTAAGGAATASTAAGAGSLFGGGNASRGGAAPAGGAQVRMMR